MVQDLNIPISVRVCPIMREADGLAMSSRNVYLSPAERVAARVISRALHEAGEAYAMGERQPQTLRDLVSRIIGAEPLAMLDYVSLSDAHTLAEQHTPTAVPLLLSTVARVGKPRLLDNVLLPLELNTLEGATSVLGAESLS
jgi:pantoate--beta-alanine ligase